MGRRTMIQVVVKNGRVLATHLDWQDIYPHYPGCEIFDWWGKTPKFNDPDPRTDEERTQDRDNADQREERWRIQRAAPMLLDVMANDQRNNTKEFSDLVEKMRNETR